MAWILFGKGKGGDMGRDVVKVPNLYFGTIQLGNLTRWDGEPD